MTLRLTKVAALHGQRHRIAFAIGIARITIHLIEKQVAHRHRAQATAELAPVMISTPPGEFLHQLGVARIARRGSFTRPASSGLASISASTRCLETRWRLPPWAAPAASAPGVVNP